MNVLGKWSRNLNKGARLTLATFIEASLHYHFPLPSLCQRFVGHANCKHYGRVAFVSK